MLHWPLLMPFLRWKMLTEQMMQPVRLTCWRHVLNLQHQSHGFINKPLTEVFDVTRMILSAKEELANESHPIDGLSGEYAEKSLEEWAERLRKGGNQ